MSNNSSLLKILKSKSKLQYQDILVYNELENLMNDQKENEHLDKSMSELMDIYDKLNNYGFSIAGYQFIGLAVSTTDAPQIFSDKLAYFILSINFIVSIIGASLSFCMYEYINGIKGESNEFIVEGILKYRTYLKLPHVLLLANTLLFVVPINILIHNILTEYFSIAFNIISFLAGFSFLIHKKMIVDEQVYGDLSRKIKRNDSENSNNKIYPSSPNK